MLFSIDKTSLYASLYRVFGPEQDCKSSDNDTNQETHKKILL
jgi:hypothetical protein